MVAHRMDAPVIFGATGDLAELDAVPVHSCPRGSRGPKEADDLLPDSRAWHDPAG